MRLRLTILFCLALLFQHSPARAESSAIDSDSFAPEIKLEGVPNLHKVSEQLYRSAQPSEVGMQNLKKLGIKTVINLRSFHSDRAKLGDTGLEYEHIYMKTWHPEREDVLRFLKIVSDPARAPFLVHCQHGADRTGAMSAIYRIVVQGWSKEKALREMTDGGFGFHEIWENLITWIDKLDIHSIKAELEHKGGID